MKLDDFDFSVIDTKGFLEDSVREEIITPILHELGYSVSGLHRIVRSKPLTHPYVLFGTVQRKINIIPDYILYVNGEPAIVIDAKNPNENIVSGLNVQQTYSYAIHTEVRARLYGLCNGRLLTIFSIFEYEPIIEIDLTNFQNNWNLIEQYLKPEYVERPYLADFHPDLGLTLLKLNENLDIEYIFLTIFVSSILKISESEYTISSGLKYGDDKFIASFDFNDIQYYNFLKIIPIEYKDEIELCLSRQPFYAIFESDHQLEISVKARITEKVIKTEQTNEEFVPFKIIEFNVIQ